MRLERWLRLKAEELLAQSWHDRESVVDHLEHDRGNLLVPRDVSGRLEENGGSLTEEEVRAAYDAVISEVESGELDPQ